MTPTIKELYRYPIKGFSPDPLARVELSVGKGFPGDRELAVTNGKWQFAAAAYKPRTKTDFLALMTHPRLAALKFRWDETLTALTLSRESQDKACTIRFDIATAGGREALEAYLVSYLDIDASQSPRLICGSDNLFTDLAPVSENLSITMSMINLATVRDLERFCGMPLDPIRFRANIYIDGLEPWQELSWMGRTLQIGSARMQVVMPTRRCVVTNVDPVNGERSQGLRIPQTIMSHFGHQNLGVYVDTAAAGQIQPGDAVALVPEDDEQAARPEIINYSNVEFPLYRSAALRTLLTQQRQGDAARNQ